VQKMRQQTLGKNADRGEKQGGRIKESGEKKEGGGGESTGPWKSRDFSLIVETEKLARNSSNGKGDTKKKKHSLRGGYGWGGREYQKTTK